MQRTASLMIRSSAGTRWRSIWLALTAGKQLSFVSSIFRSEMARDIVSLLDMLGLTFPARALVTTCVGKLVENVRKSSEQGVPATMCNFPGLYQWNFNGQV